MPSSRRPRTPLPNRRPSPDRARAGAPLAAAAAFAAAELVLGLYVAGLWLSGRAEAVGFLAFRPWLLILLAAGVARLPWRRRLAFYAAALAVAGTAESVLLLIWGAPNPLPEMLRGWAAAALLLVPVDLLLAFVRRRGRIAVAAAALGLCALLFVPAVQRGWEALALETLSPPEPSPPEPSPQKPELLLMTALPIVWGEGGAFDPASRPARAYRALQAEFAVRPIDTLGADTLSGGRLILLAQPRWLSPGELVALDAWVRGGGRALILTDPRLAWPSELPVGDIRRPPPIALLGPLLGHWGLGLAPAPGEGVETARLGDRVLAMERPGRFAARGDACRVLESWRARCRIGAGEAVLIADADLMRDDMWAGPGPRGGARHRRLADNPLVLADLLDGLAGIERPRPAGAVRWADPARRTGTSVLAILAALATLLAAGLLLARRRRG
ncbi:MAG: hypothetical protein ACK40O_05945 [Allosphingosinicella sp.]